MRHPGTLDPAPASLSSVEQPTRGACFGYEIRSALAFEFLREGSGDLLDICLEDRPWRPDRTPLFEWMPRSDRPLHARIYRENGTYRLWTDREGWFAVDPSIPSIAAPPVPDPIRLEERILGIPMLLCFMHRGDLPLHAAAVEINGRAVVLAAPGHFGKTTFAGAFQAAGFRVLSEDITCCRLGPPATVLPGPSLLRVRDASRESLRLSNTRCVAEEPGRTHLALEGAARGTGDAVPLAGIVFLRHGDGEGHLEPVAPDRALPDLYVLSLKFPTDADRARCFKGTAALAASVPLWNLHRALRFDTMPRLIDLIAETCLART